MFSDISPILTFYRPAGTIAWLFSQTHSCKELLTLLYSESVSLEAYDMPNRTFRPTFVLSHKNKKSVLRKVFISLASTSWTKGAVYRRTRQCFSSCSHWKLLFLVSVQLTKCTVHIPRTICDRVLGCTNISYPGRRRMGCVILHHHWKYWNEIDRYPNDTGTVRESARSTSTSSTVHRRTSSRNASNSSGFSFNVNLMTSAAKAFMSLHSVHFVASALSDAEQSLVEW